MIRTRNIRRRYREIEVLKGIDLDIRKGEIISIVGASGAGKTTLLQILGTLDYPDEGTVYFNDQPIRKQGNTSTIYAEWYKRLFHGLFDLALIVALEFALMVALYGYYTPETLLDEHWFQKGLFHLGAISALGTLYYLVLEWLTGKTIGKLLTGTRVITKFGKKPGFGTILLRSLGRLVPGEAFSFFAKKPENGLHDGISNTIVINDRHWNENTPYTYRQLGDDGLARFRNEEIGFVFQFHHLLPEFTALENVIIPGLIQGRNRSEVENHAGELLQFLGLHDRMDHKPSQLSGGEQQRVAVARALINRPAIVLADEPSGNLDSQSARDLHQLFFDLRDQYQQTFIIVTHNEELANLADRKLVIKDGVISSDSTPDAETPSHDR